jgi:hypothetical protein
MADVEQAANILSSKLAGILQRRGTILIESDRAELTAGLVEFVRASKGDREIMLQQKIERFVEPPDRRPIDPNSPWIKDGEYAPFLVKAEQAQKEAQKALSTLPQVNGKLPVGINPDDLARGLAFSRAGNA